MSAEVYEKEIERLFDFNGVDALIEHQNLTQYFYEWNLLSPQDWISLIKSNPVFLRKAARFLRGQIAILASFPNRRDLCNKIDEFSQYDFSELFVLRKGKMTNFPEWDFSNLDSYSWLMILDFSKEYENIAKNYFAGRIALLCLGIIPQNCFNEYELLSIENWRFLLRRNEKFSQTSKFPNGKIALFSKGMADLKSIDFSQLSGDNWAFLLKQRVLDGIMDDTLIEHSKEIYQIACDFSYWKKLSRQNWQDILRYAKSYDVRAAACSRKIFKYFSSAEWVELLLVNKNFELQFLSYSDWTSLDKTDWNRLLSTDSYFEKYNKTFGQDSPCRSKAGNAPKYDFIEIDEWLTSNTFDDVNDPEQWITLLKSAEYPAYLDDCIEHKCWNKLPQELQERFVRVYPHIIERIKNHENI